ncbi:MAG TPA: DUF6288 domain-containing protein [Planctomycetota bacterium]
MIPIPSFVTRGILGLALVVSAAPPASAQVHYQGGGPWNQKANGGPDAEVDGWYYNLGITGLRVELMEAQPQHLLVKHVFAGTPADGKILVGDVLVRAAASKFDVEHVNGYGMDKFGPRGPILEFADALEASQSKAGKGLLELHYLREGEAGEAVLDVGLKYGTFAKSFPADCAKSERIRDELLDYLLAHQRDDGSWGSPPHDTFAPLALLSSGTKEHMAAVRRNVEFHARTTSAEDESWLINWRYMAAAIVMSEYYLATKEEWVLPELDQVYRFLISTQYVDLAQVNPKAKESHPHTYPKNAMDSHGGWGHNPGFEGYGPISMLSAQGALAFALMRHCGIDVDRERHDAAYAFVERATGRNGYVWYKDSPAGADDWADMGRTGAAGIGNLLSPYKDKVYRKRARAHARVIGEHPESFPDTHGSPIMGMGYAAMAAAADPKSFRRLMAANRWWFTLSQCADGSFYYQPNRDNAGYGADSRLSASAVTAFLLSIPQERLHGTGKAF